MDLFGHILRGESDKADANRKFYDEYFAVSDLPAEFYLETVRKVFQEYHLPRGIFDYRGNARSIPRAIRKTALLTVEGEKDDICSVGQTMAAHDLRPASSRSARSIMSRPASAIMACFPAPAGQTQIYPMVRNMILSSE